MLPSIVVMAKLSHSPHAEGLKPHGKDRGRVNRCFQESVQRLGSGKRPLNRQFSIGCYETQWASSGVWVCLFAYAISGYNRISVWPADPGGFYKPLCARQLF